MINVSTLPQMGDPTANRPYGQFVDVSAPGLQDGVPARSDWLSDCIYALIAVMHRVGINPDGNEEGTVASQFAEAIVNNVRRLNTALDENTTLEELLNDRDIFCSPTADRTMDITNGSSRQGTELTIYNNSATYKVTVTYFTSSTVDLTPSMFIKFKWNGVRWVCIAESRIGKIDHGYIVPRGGAELNGGLRTKDALWKYIQTYYASLIDTEVNWQAGLVGKFVDYDSTQYRLPDFRGLFERNAGTNSKRLMANGSAFAGETVGSVDNDMMFGHEHASRYRNISGSGAWNVMTYAQNTATGNNSGAGGVGLPISDGTNGTPRTGAETKPASVSLIPFIYFED